MIDQKTIEDNFDDWEKLDDEEDLEVPVFKQVVERPENRIFYRAIINKNNSGEDKSEKKKRKKKKANFSKKPRGCYLDTYLAVYVDEDNRVYWSANGKRHNLTRTRTKLGAFTLANVYDILETIVSFRAKQEEKVVPGTVIKYNGKLAQNILSDVRASYKH